MLFIRLSAVLLLVLASVPTAHAATITFDSATPGVFLTAPYTESGFLMTLVTGHYDFFGSGGTGDSDYVNIDTVNFGPAKITFTRSGGGAFDLTSFDVIDPGGGLLTSPNGGSFTLSSTG